MSESWFDELLNSGTASKLLNLGIGVGAEYLGLNDPQISKVGYQGEIPDYDFVRERVPGTNDPNRRPGSSGRRYFTSPTYSGSNQPVPTGVLSTPEGLRLRNAFNPSYEKVNPLPSSGGIFSGKGVAVEPTKETMDARRAVLEYYNPSPSAPSVTPTKETLQQAAKDYYNRAAGGFAAGGIAGLREGRYLDGASDGMADEVPATIEGEQEAMLSDGEFVIPADVVSHLGNGNSDAGAKELYDMMDRVRKARTGTTKQGKKIDPDKFLPA